VERVIGPDATTVIDFMLSRLKGIIDGLVVYPKNMERNMNLTRGLWHSQGVLLALVDAGVQRDEAYTWVQRNALKVWEGDKDFKGLLRKDEDIVKVLGVDAIEDLFDLSHHLAYVDAIFERVFHGKDR
jgi:adenylosuccinate lyase